MQFNVFEEHLPTTTSVPPVCGKNIVKAGLWNNCFIKVRHLFA